MRRAKRIIGMRENENRTGKAGRILVQCILIVVVVEDDDDGITLN